MLKSMSIAVPAFIFSISTAFASPVLLTADEIEVLLSGNTVIGEWSGTPYKQYFDPNGATIYVPEGGASDTGGWRVNEDENTYESYWRFSGWSSYEISQEDEVYFWIESNGNKQAFTIEEGNVLHGEAQ